MSFQIDCKNLFNLLESFTATSTFAKPKTWTDIPLELRNKYTYNERLKLFLWILFNSFSFTQVSSRKL